MHFDTKNTQYPIATKEATFSIMSFPQFTNLLTHCPGVSAPTPKGKGGEGVNPGKAIPSCVNVYRAATM